MGKGSTMNFAHYLKNQKPVIAMVRLKGGSLGEILRRAKREIGICFGCGADAVLVENASGTARECEAVLKWLRDKRPDAIYGVNIPGDCPQAFRLASACGARFILVDSVCGYLPPDQDKEFAEKLHGLRAGCGVAVLGGVRFKGQPLLSGMDEAEEFRLGMKRCDAIVTAGGGMNGETLTRRLCRIGRILGDFPLVVGTGVTATAVAENLRLCDGAIVGHCVEDGACGEGGVNEPLLHSFMQRAMGSRINWFGEAAKGKAVREELRPDGESGAAAGDVFGIFSRAFGEKRRHAGETSNNPVTEDLPDASQRFEH